MQHQTQYPKELQILLIGGDMFTGKSTLSRQIAEKYPQFFVESVSTTTRDRRLGDGQHKEEVNGKDYYFVPDKSIFTDENFIEFEKFTDEEGNTTYYGTAKSEMEKAYRNQKILILVLDPKGIDNFYRNIDHIEVDGEKIPLKKTILLLDIKKESIYKRLDKLVNKTLEPEKYNKEVARIERGGGKIAELINSLGIRGYADITRTDYLPEHYLGDIMKCMPTRVQDFIRCEVAEQKKKGAVLKSAFLEVMNDGMYNDMLPSEIDTMIKRGRIDFTLVREVAQKHNIPPNEITEFAKAHLEFPMYWEDPEGINSDKFRLSNKTLVKELIEDVFSGNTDATIDEVLKIQVGGYTPHGYEGKVKLEDLEDFSLRDLGISENLLNTLVGNDIVKRAKDRNAEKREKKRARQGGKSRLKMLI